MSTEVKFPEFQVSNDAEFMSKGHSNVSWISMPCIAFMHYTHTRAAVHCLQDVQYSIQHNRITFELTYFVFPEMLCPSLPAMPYF